MTICQNCGKQTKNPKFCSRSCAAVVNNLTKPKKKLLGKCFDCNIICPKRRKYCNDCFAKKFFVDENEIYADMTSKRKYQKNSRIRNLARAKYRKSDKQKKCAICGYDKHYEVCHIKSISSFADDSTIKEINDFSNLIALCRNCHWELDNGHLDFSEFEDLHSPGFPDEAQDV